MREGCNRVVGLAAAGVEVDNQRAIVNINESTEAQTRLNDECRMKEFF